MDEKRKGEIALRLVRYMLWKRGLHLSRNDMREMGNVAKSIGVPLDELREFARPMMQEFLDEFLADKSEEAEETE